MPFTSARPVWAANRHHEMNLTLGLRAVLPPGTGCMRLAIAARTAYRVWCNGSFAG